VLHHFALWAGYAERTREGYKFVVADRPERTAARGEHRRRRRGTSRLHLAAPMHCAAVGGGVVRRVTERCSLVAGTVPPTEAELVAERARRRDAAPTAVTDGPALDFSGEGLPALEG
jgi:hypothetical protein